MPPRGTRPTTDRVRESLFNVLAARIVLPGASVLDLFAGSGALGLVALSRGAATAMFVESDRRAAAVIDQNVRTLGVTGATLYRGTVVSVLAAGAATAADLVFADPPYDTGEAEVNEMLTALTTRGWTAAGSVVVVERAASGPELTWPDGWERWPTRRYGDTGLEMAVVDVAASAAPNVDVAASAAPNGPELPC